MNAAPSNDPVCITGLGMATALGCDAPNACAAARAGLLRLRELKVLNFQADQIWGGGPVKGHTVPLGAEGSLGVSKALTLGRLALADLMSRLPLARAELARTALHLNLADQFLTDAHEVAVRTEAKQLAAAKSSIAGGKPVEVDENAPLPSARWAEQCKDFIPRLLRRCGLEGSPASSSVSFGGHTGVVPTLQKAVDDLRRLDRCLVGGIDCCVEPAFLTAAVAAGLLKTDENPVGFLPGEAAAFFMLEKLAAARARGAKVLAVLGPSASSREKCDRLSDTLPQGIALTGVIREVLAGQARNGQRLGLVVGDLNGDVARGMEWGHALPRLHPEFRLGDLPLWLAAQSFGETGAAAGPLAVCLAAQALQRGYAPSPAVLIWLASDNGSRAALSVEAAPA
jgi:3-oxoacyl-[acyl-carrier-protein] synthase I